MPEVAPVVKVTVWDVGQGKELLSFDAHEILVSSVAFSHDGACIVSSGGDSLVKVWDSETGELLHTLEGDQDYVQCVAVSPNGKRIASGGQGRSIKIWDMDSGKELLAIQTRERVLSLAFSPDGKLLAGAGLNFTPIRTAIGFWDSESGEFKMGLKSPRFPVNAIYSIAFSPDGTQLVSAGPDKRLAIWNLTSGEISHFLTGHADIATGADFSADGKKIISRSRDNLIKLWDAASGREIQTFQGHSTNITGVGLWAWEPVDRQCW